MCVICRDEKCVREMERAFCMLELPINSDVAGVKMTAEIITHLPEYRRPHFDFSSSSKNVSIHDGIVTLDDTRRDS